MNNENKRFIVEQEGNAYFVKDTKGDARITGEVPEKHIADEIAEDFNKMEGGDYSPLIALGLPVDVANLPASPEPDSQHIDQIFKEATFSSIPIVDAYYKSTTSLHADYNITIGIEQFAEWLYKRDIRPAHCPADPIAAFSMGWKMGEGVGRSMNQDDFVKYRQQIKELTEEIKKLKAIHS
jgi:hypothetical protein